MSRAKCLILAVLCLYLAGCGALAVFGVGAAAGIGGYKYYEGALTVVFLSPFDDTWKASLSALDQLDIKVERSEHGLSSGKITAKTSDKKPVSLSMKANSDKETECVIRVGYFGDKNASDAIKEKIRKVLYG